MHQFLQHFLKFPLIFVYNLDMKLLGLIKDEPFYFLFLNLNLKNLIK